MAKPIRQQTWSRIDALGLLNGVSVWDPQYRTLRYVRRPFDSTLDIRNKIFSYHDNPVGTTKQGLVNALSNEFDLEHYNVLDRKMFELTYNPSVSGAAHVSDISCYYQEPGSDTWIQISQIWSDQYADNKADNNGFIVWQRERYTNDTEIKNFRYSNIAEVLADIPDNSEIKFVYYITDSDIDGNATLVQFTDMNNPYDAEAIRFTYRKANAAPSLSGAVVYTLDDIPANVKSNYYETNGKPKEQLYTIKDHLDKKFKHTWGKISDGECIWDVHKLYGSGHVPSFYNAESPDNASYCSHNFSGYVGGITELSPSLYPISIEESNDTTQTWKLVLYPGKFYIDGTPFYNFENPQSAYIKFVNGEATLPSGLERGMYTIMAKSGYYENPCGGFTDAALSNIYEDYNYQTGDGAETLWTYIYRHRPYVTSDHDHEISLMEGEYHIDFDGQKIYSNYITDVKLIWDQVLEPSGVVLNYDLNPLNEQNLTFEKFFLFLTLNR